MGSAMAWALLILSGILDVAWAVSVKMADGYSRPAWSLLSFVLLAAFVHALGKALQALPLGTAYAVWTGIGAVGSVVVGIAMFHEPVTFARFFWIAVTLGGIVGLKLTTA
ncbi:multidrug efflux SMR transporter [Azospirillum sp. B506]|uniref:DMT family transporter n=1 Tax=Azospirillum sp. B506 TaxID=137721 RepID=UPI001FCB2B26|nr:multidrug efflux SMR transporter [Azospirillum sp. B506]